MNSRKSLSRILHNRGLKALEFWPPTHYCWPGLHYILWRWIDMQRGGCGAPSERIVLEGAGMTSRASLRRHASGDWSELFPEDTKENESSPRHGFRLLSSYPLGTGAKVWIVTERDGNTTTSTDVPGWLGWHHTGGVKVTAPNP